MRVMRENKTTEGSAKRRVTGSGAGEGAGPLLSARLKGALLRRYTRRQRQRGDLWRMAGNDPRGWNFLHLETITLARESALYELLMGRPLLANLNNGSFKQLFYLGCEDGKGAA